MSWVQYHCLLFCCLYTLVPYRTGAQCRLEVDIGPDRKVCSSAETILSAEVTGTILSFKWLPDEALDNPFSLHPAINTAVNTSFHLSVKGYDETQNLLANSDFSEGDSGFSSQYESGKNTPGGYIIGSLGTELFPDAKACEDHTGSGGKMMMVRVAETDNLDIWCQEVSVEANQEYHFNAFATGLRINNPPVILLKINDELLSVGTLGSFACSWQKVKADWNSGNSNTARICLSVSEEDIGAGTDFALDDMGFYRVCEVEDEVRVEVVPLEIEVEQPVVTLPCQKSIELQAVVNPADPNTLYQWNTADGNIVEGRQDRTAVVDAPGLYEFQAVLEADGLSCAKSIQVEVIELSEEPLEIEVPELLGCNQSEITLEASHPSPASGFHYQWTTTDGTILSAGDSQAVTVNAGGTYTLTLTELSTGCTVSKTIMLPENQPLTFEYEVNGADCEDPFYAIVFQNVTGGVTPYEYSIDGGENFQAANSFALLPWGEYLLAVRDADGCQRSEALQLVEYNGLQLELDPQVTLEKGTVFPMPARVNLPDSLLQSIKWTPSAGLSCTDCLNPALTAVANTVYQLEVIDRDQCRRSASIQVFLTERAEIFVPTAFSPNGDGKNDLFVLYGDETVVKTINYLRVFNRYGALLFEQRDFRLNDPISGWNGLYQGDLLQPGIFLFTTEMELHDGRTKLINGTIALLR